MTHKIFFIVMAISIFVALNLGFAQIHFDAGDSVAYIVPEADLV